MTDTFTFIKRPEKVQALPWLGNNADALRKFCIDEDGESVLVKSNVKIIDEEYTVTINSNLGEQLVPLGSWIVKSKGQFIVYDAMEFNESYDAENG